MLAEQRWETLSIVLINSIASLVGAHHEGWSTTRVGEGAKGSGLVRTLRSQECKALLTH